MTMKTTLSHYEAVSELLDDTYANWTRDEAEALVDYYEELEEDMDEAIEFDATSIRCDWNSYADFNELQADYSEYFNNHDIKTIDDLQDYIQVIDCGSSLLVGAF